MEVRNYTPFPNLRFTGMDNAGTLFGVLLVKGTFSITPDGAMVPADEQAPVLLTDAYHGDLFTTSLWIPSDLAPHKPRTDVILNAVARAPGGKPLPTWECGIEVSGARPLRKVLRVTGPRSWEPVWLGPAGERVGAPDDRRLARFLRWRLSPSAPAAEVPIRYELAFGGMLAKPQGVDEQGRERPPYLEPWQHNPIGCGWINRELTPTDQARPAPQVEDPHDPIRNPFATHTPQGFSPIPPDWLPRRPLGGTYDQAWMEGVWPSWPADYDFAYHNAAHPDLIHPGFLDGDETVTLWGLDGRPDQQMLRLPALTCIVEQTFTDGSVHEIRMALDTLVLDVADPDPEEHRAFVSWRTTFDNVAVGRSAVLGASVQDVRALSYHAGTDRPSRSA